MSDPDPPDGPGIVEQFKQLDEAEQRWVLDHLEHLSPKDAFAVIGAWHSQQADQRRLPFEPWEIEAKDDTDGEPDDGN